LTDLTMDQYIVFHYRIKSINLQKEIMKFIKYSFFVVLLFCFLPAYSQIDSLIIEKYYISDLNDATNITGGVLPGGSVTYRIYVDMAPGSRLLKVYGTTVHPIQISSTEIFYNNSDRGRSFGKEIRSSRLDENTVALDSWLTIGLASDNHYGILKTEDTDGSIVGGVNNDGGSQSIPGGLLINADPLAGTPLITADGLVRAVVFPANFICKMNGSDLLSLSDTTIFGNLYSKKSFVSDDFFMSCSGVSGPTAANRVLIAQLTTKGSLRFSFNIEIEQTVNGITSNVKYVASNPQADEKMIPSLTYPLPCGCKDPDYLEFSKIYGCHIQDSCKRRVVYGCLDPLACNFDPEANFHINTLCCYPGRCNDRDIRVVCPELLGKLLVLKIFPNPSQDILNLEFPDNSREGTMLLSVFNSNGSIVLQEMVENKRLSNWQINVSCLQKGIYILKLDSGSETILKRFIKN